VVALDGDELDAGEAANGGAPGAVRGLLLPVPAERELNDLRCDLRAVVGGALRVPGIGFRRLPQLLEDAADDVNFALDPVVGDRRLVAVLQDLELVLVPLNRMVIALAFRRLAVLLSLRGDGVLEPLLELANRQARAVVL